MEDRKVTQFSVRIFEYKCVWSRSCSVALCDCPVLARPFYLVFLTWKLVIDLAILCSFQRMRSHLGVKEADPSKFPADKLAAVADVLRKSTFLKVSEDGALSPFSLPFSCSILKADHGLIL